MHIEIQPQNLKRRADLGHITLDKNKIKVDYILKE